MPKRDYESYNILEDEIKDKHKERELNQKINGLKEAGLTEKTNGLKEAGLTEKTNGLKETGLADKTNELKETGLADKTNELKETGLADKTNELKETDLADKTNRLKEADMEQVQQITTERRKIDGVQFHKQDNQVAQSNYNDEEMTFSKYKDNYQNKERGFIAKWSLRIGKLILLIMLLPFLGVIAGAVVAFFCAFIGAIIVCLGTGVFIIGVTSFFATQISSIFIALGIFTSITVSSFGLILLLLFIMLIKKILELMYRFKKPKKVAILKEAR